MADHSGPNARGRASEGLLGLTAEAIEAAFHGGAEILEVYQTEFEVRLKDDRSPLTEADERSQKTIHEWLRGSGPALPFLGEEGRDIPYAERRDWKRFWLVDPLDGTKEFVSRNGEFTVNIALIDGGVPILGVVYAPLLGVFYWGAAGHGAFRLDGRPVPEADLVEASQRLPSLKTEQTTIAASRSHRNAETDAYIDECREVFGEVAIHSSGSSLKMCHVAEGRADIYPRLGHTFEWDVAAGQAVIEQAGGILIEASSRRPLRYNKEDLLNPYFLCCSATYKERLP
jgi:3'(2'), 5'-bisphosphate nucleotidase